MVRADGKWSRQFFEELAEVAPERALAVAQNLPSEREADLAVQASRILLARGGTERDEQIDRLIQVLLRPESGWEERGAAMKLLVPEEDPLRYPDKKIDLAILKVLNPEMADELTNFSLSAACRALALRGRVEHFPAIAESFAKVEDGHVAHGILSSLAQLSRRDPAELRPKLEVIVRPHLKETRFMMSEILWSVWAADLREIAPRLREIATHDLDEYESGKANSYGPMELTTGRFHFARQIIALWDEPDPTTRARLLVALMANEPYNFTGGRPEALDCAKATMQVLAKQLTAADKAAVAKMVDRLVADPPELDGEQLAKEDAEKIANLDIEPRLLDQAVELGGHPSKRAAVEAALTEYINRYKQQAILGLFGEIEFDPKYDHKKARQQPCESS